MLIPCIDYLPDWHCSVPSQLIVRIFSLRFSVKETKLHYSVLPLKNCNRMLHAVCWLGAGASILSTLLFLLRVNSVFFDSKGAKRMFTILWGATSISLLVLPFSFTAETSELDGLCIISSLSRLGSIPSLTVGVFDLTIFISISYRIMTQDTTISVRKRFVAFITGTNIGPVSKALVRTGQLYFL